MRTLTSISRFVVNCVLFHALILSHPAWSADAEQLPAEGQLRPARNDRELRAWLENMVWHHGYSLPEIQSVLGLDEAAIQSALERFQIRAETKPPRPVDPPLLVLPYPGGRHPRIGFLDGAVAPQRETKLSVFTPWDQTSYVVQDVPEAVWSDLGLTYLAHTHVETVWSKQGVTLPQMEWHRRDDGSFTFERRLPNGIRFGVVATPQRDRVELRMWLTNGTNQPLSKMRVQMCAMLKGARGFADQTNNNKILRPPFAACRNAEGNRWIIQAWQPCQRAWGNPPCPCLHSDPQLPDCEPGATTEVHGWLSFYQGTDIDAELQRIAEIWQPQDAVKVQGTVLDSRTREHVAARVYIQSDAGASYFVEQPAGKAVRYDKQNWVNTAAVERHTTIMPGPFQVSLPSGKYVATIERGKEYRPLVREFTVEREPVTLDLPLERWIDMVARGWYGGDTHVHRSLAELPNVMLAEDLNVAFPLTYWVTKAFAPPGQGDRTDATDATAPAELITVDDSHVIWPRNTEWEIFTINGQRHTLGAVFALNHKQPFAAGIPPLAPIVEQAQREGALFDMDKHDWPFAMMLPTLLGQPTQQNSSNVAPVLYELANNHMWRTNFGFTNWNSSAPEWFGLGSEVRQGGEREWIEFTHRNYWTLLDCGHRLMPTAGTASGVHPVPLGFGRVYVHLPEGLDYAAWLRGLAAGQSFVTTGPMLFVESDGSRVHGTICSETSIQEAEVIVNGAIRERVSLSPRQNAEGAWESQFDQALELDGTSWLAVRVFEPRANQRIRFAHSAPQWFAVEGRPLRPRPEEVDYLLDRVREEIERSRAILPPDAVAEYEIVLRGYEALRK